MSCVLCIWYDEEERRCIRLGKRIFMPNRIRLCPYYNVVPELVANYVSGIVRFTGIDLDKVLRSRPVKNYLRKVSREVTF